MPASFYFLKTGLIGCIPHLSSLALLTTSCLTLGDLLNFFEHLPGLLCCDGSQVGFKGCDKIVCVKHLAGHGWSVSIHSLIFPASSLMVVREILLQRGTKKEGSARRTYSLLQVQLGRV